VAHARAAERAHAVAEQERRAQPARRLERPGPRLHDPPEADHPDGDEQRVGEHARDHDGDDVLVAQRLAQYEGVLRPDGDDEERARGEASREGRPGHAGKLRSRATSDQLNNLQMH
jgi:hypothetical protein